MPRRAPVEVESDPDAVALAELVVGCAHCHAAALEIARARI